MDLIDHGDERANRHIADNFIRILEARRLRHRPPSVPGYDVWVRLVQDVRVRRLLANPLDQLEV
jgi:hypothetical protein